MEVDGEGEEEDDDDDDDDTQTGFSEYIIYIDVFVLK